MAKSNNPPVFGKIQPGVNYVERPGAYGFLFDELQRLAVVQTSFGFFLPGGGQEPNETPEVALRREIFEEIGFTVTRAELVTTAVQFHWSEFYQTYFKKIGSFYRVEAAPAASRHLQAEHDLLWWPREEAARRLSQEFQRWAVGGLK
jgi:8-oxo-dGTP diphosphatase